ncbi:MAG: hypothetical protein IPM27_11300 [Nitrosomonadales bacterium]|nr:hypothetical protein [Nitrosomonadales bacterium]MBK9162125.1 hypothetical protein [Nitrosomonadales bacterium]
MTTTPVQAQTQNRQVLGKEMMSQEERDEQRNKMRNATTAEERETIRSEQHEEMKARASELGKSISDTPSTRRQGGGQGKGSGMGSGMGGGMGGGQGGMGSGRGGR